MTYGVQVKVEGPGLKGGFVGQELRAVVDTTQAGNGTSGSAHAIFLAFNNVLYLKLTYVGVYFVCRSCFCLLLLCFFFPIVFIVQCMLWQYNSLTFKPMF